MECKGVASANCFVSTVFPNQALGGNPTIRPQALQPQIKCLPVSRSPATKNASGKTEGRFECSREFFGDVSTFKIAKNLRLKSKTLLTISAVLETPPKPAAETPSATKTIRVAVLGASGYTGAEIVRLLHLHPNAQIKYLCADRKAGMHFASVFPHLSSLDLPDLVKIEQCDWENVDLVFCCLPHGTTQEIIASLPAHLKVVDLSADFRLFNVATYAQWYGHEHNAPELQKEAVYGLVELYRDDIKKARLVANPGCYPTCSQLPLVPLVKAGLISPDDIVIDAKSGTSGAGRGAKENLLFTEITEGINAYGIGSHRHAPEIEQGIGEAAGKDVVVCFTPHLMPMSRGMLCSSYVHTTDGKTADDLRAYLQKFYQDEPFVHVINPSDPGPATRFVRGSNHCYIGVYPDRIPGRAIIISVIDNLVKGASGQAIQNMNLMFGLDETTALSQMPMFP